jgi:hypothetical protein
MKTNKAINEIEIKNSESIIKDEIDYKDLYEKESQKTKAVLEEKNKWEQLAKIYSERFAQAFKGFLILQGATEQKAESEKQKILKEVKI